MPKAPNDVKSALAALKKAAKPGILETMGPRYGIHTKKAFGVGISDIQKVAKRLGRNHDLAGALWKTGWYEGRLLAAYIDEPERVTPGQMDSWAKDWDNWGICDTVCFVLFDRTPHAFAKVAKWSKSREEFVKRGAFALLACVALHDKKSGDEPFAKTLPLIEKGAIDERNFVKKGVSWALRAVATRSASLRADCIALATRLAANHDSPAARWVGKDALRQLSKKK